MTEEIIEVEKQSNFKFAFRWGSIIGFITLVYYLIGFYTGFEKQLYFSDIYFFMDIALIALMITEYRKEMQLTELKFKRILLIGMYSALVVAGFYALYFFLRMNRLEPLFFQAYIGDVIKMIKEQFDIDYSQMFKPQMMGMFKGVFLFSIYVSSFISSMIYTLLLAAFFTLNRRVYKRK